MRDLLSLAPLLSHFTLIDQDRPLTGDGNLENRSFTLLHAVLPLALPMLGLAARRHDCSHVFEPHSYTRSPRDCTDLSGPMRSVELTSVDHCQDRNPFLILHDETGAHLTPHLLSTASRESSIDMLGASHMGYPL